MVKSVIKIKDAIKAGKRVRSNINARAITISREGMVHTRKGVQELGKGWLFISPMKRSKSRNLLTPAYRKSKINNAAIASSATCLLLMMRKGSKSEGSRQRREEKRSAAMC